MRSLDKMNFIQGFWLICLLLIFCSKLENEFILYGQKETERVGGNLLESLVNFERITIYIY
jgi:hypothetical protein